MKKIVVCILFIVGFFNLQGCATSSMFGYGYTSSEFEDSGYTSSNFEEVENFILTMIKPEYDNWKGKEDYEKRFLEVLSKLFQ